MSSPSNINRENAQHSTGPKTEEGKRKSSLNALRHGLSGQIVVMPAEDMGAYHQHLHSFTNEYQPQGATESTLVQFLAETAWRLHRVAALETNLLTLGITYPTSYTADAPQEIQDALSVAAALEKHSRSLSNLSLHSQRLSRQFERTLLQLRELQKTRRAEEAGEMNKALDLRELAESMGEPYDPSSDGFVFSLSETDTAFLLRNRDRRAAKACGQRTSPAA